MVACRWWIDWFVIRSDVLMHKNTRLWLNCHSNHSLLLQRLRRARKTVSDDMTITTSWIGHSSWGGAIHSSWGVSWPLNGCCKPPEQGFGQKIKTFGAFIVQNVFLGVVGGAITVLPTLPPGYACQLTQWKKRKLIGAVYTVHLQRSDASWGWAQLPRKCKETCALWSSPARR